MPRLLQEQKAQALEHMRPQGAMCSSVDNFVNNFHVFGKIPTFPCRGVQKVGKIPIPTNRISNIHIGKIPVFALQKVGKIPTFGWFSVCKSRKNSGFSSINLLSSSAATTAIYTLLKIKGSRSTKNFEKFLMFLIAPARARREKRRNVAPALANTPLSMFFSTESGVPSFFALPRRGTTIQFSEVIS